MLKNIGRYQQIIEPKNMSTMDTRNKNHVYDGHAKQKACLREHEMQFFCQRDEPTFELNQLGKLVLQWHPSPIDLARLAPKVEDG